MPWITQSSRPVPSGGSLECLLAGWPPLRAQGRLERWQAERSHSQNSTTIMDIEPITELAPQREAAVASPAHEETRGRTLRIIRCALAVASMAAAFAFAVWSAFPLVGLGICSLVRYLWAGLTSFFWRRRVHLEFPGELYDERRRFLRYHGRSWVETTAEGPIDLGRYEVLPSQRLHIARPSPTGKFVRLPIDEHAEELATLVESEMCDPTDPVHRDFPTYQRKLNQLLASGSPWRVAHPSLRQADVAQTASRAMQYMTFVSSGKVDFLEVLHSVELKESRLSMTSWLLHWSLAREWWERVRLFFGRNPTTTASF